jgi:hypothetical protein
MKRRLKWGLAFAVMLACFVALCVDRAHGGKTSVENLLVGALFVALTGYKTVAPRKAKYGQ